MKFLCNSKCYFNSCDDCREHILVDEDPNIREYIEIEKDIKRYKEYQRRRKYARKHRK